MLELRTGQGDWNGFEIRRLKDKLGTRAMPTAEIALMGALAQPVGGIGSGVAKAASMLNVARLWAGQAAPAVASYLLDLARDYAQQRRIGGETLARLPAHAHWIAELAARHEAMLALCLDTSAEAGKGNAGLARLLAPAMKFHCAREGIAVCSELLESFGGAGYLEDTGLPAIFRNAHVHTIWEGTSSVMAQDVMRALSVPGLAQAWEQSIAARLATLRSGPAAEAAGIVLDALEAIEPGLGEPDPADARRLAGAIARITAALALAETAVWRLQQKQDRTGMLALARAVRQPLVPPAANPDDLALAFPAALQNQDGAPTL